MSFCCIGQIEVSTYPQCFEKSMEVGVRIRVLPPPPHIFMNLFVLPLCMHFFGLSMLGLQHGNTSTGYRLYKKARLILSVIELLKIGRKLMHRSQYLQNLSLLGFGCFTFL